jgi:hypothetical protein
MRDDPGEVAADLLRLMRVAIRESRKASAAGNEAKAEAARDAYVVLQKWGQHYRFANRHLDVECRMTWARKIAPRPRQGNQPERADPSS